MAVIPSGTSEPWHWMAREAASNDALSRLFVQENMRREMQQNQFGENAVNRDWRSGQQDKQLSWQGDKLNQQQQFASEQNALNRENAMSMTQYRTDAAGARAGAGKAGKNQIVFGNDVIQAWNEIEQKYKLPQGYLSTIVGIESAGGANMHRPGAQYHGPFQFGNEAAKEMGITMAQRYDPIASGEAAAKFAAMNREYATKMSNGAIRWTGGPQDIAKLYMLHNQGRAGGWQILLPANATRQAFQVGHPGNLMNNMVTSSDSSQQAIEKFEKKLIPWYQSYGQRMSTIGGGAPATPANNPVNTGQPQPQPQSTTQQPPMQQPPVQPPPTASGPAVQTQSMPATNPSTPATAQQPQPPQAQTQPQIGGGSVPPSTISPQVFAQPPNAVAGASGAGAPQPLTQGAPVTATSAPSDITQMPQAGGAVAMPSSQTTNVTGAPAGAVGDRATPSLAAPPPAGTRKKVTKYIDDDGVLRFSAPQ